MDAGKANRDSLLKEINADLPPGLDWRAGALNYVSAEIAKHGREAYTRFLLGKPLAPIPHDPAVYQAHFQENLGYLCNFVNAFSLLSLPGGSRILDVACGSGWFSQHFARMGYDAIGFDISAEMIGIARRRWREDALLTHLYDGLGERLFQCDIEREPLPARLHGTVSAVVLESCLHHFVDPVFAMSNLVPALNEGGVVIIIEGENRTGPLRPEYIRVMAEFATLERPYTRAQLEAVLDTAGLRHRRFMGRLNGWYSPDDPRVPSLPELVRRDADGLNLAVCATSAKALRRVLPHYPAPDGATAPDVECKPPSPTPDCAQTVQAPSVIRAGAGAPPALPEEPRVFFMHVSKTAGTSALRYLERLFRPEEICSGPRTGIWSYSPAEVKQYRLYHGHFYHDFIDGFGGRKLKLIILREPCRRLVSLYDYWRSHTWDHIADSFPPLPINGPAVAKLSSFSEFLTVDNPYVQRDISSPAARQLLGAGVNVLAMGQAEAAALCLSRLRTFDWIGITESFPVSLRMLARLLGGPEPDLRAKPANRTYYADATGTEPVGQTKPTQAEIELMRRASRLDTVVYEEARRIFAERRAAAGL